MEFVHIEIENVKRKNNLFINTLNNQFVIGLDNF